MSMHFFIIPQKQKYTNNDVAIPRATFSNVTSALESWAQEIREFGGEPSIATIETVLTLNGWSLRSLEIECNERGIENPVEKITNKKNFN